MTEKEKKEASHAWKIASALLLLSGLGCLIGGLLMHFILIDSIVESQIKSQSQLVPGSRIMKKWSDPEYKVQFKVYVYSVRNPDEMLAGAIPEVRESGPYTFDKKIHNHVIAAGNGTVQFKRRQLFFFNEKDSCETCILGNRIWVPNLIFQKFVEAASTIGMKGAVTALISQTAFLEVEVGELLFEGYKDPFLDKVCEIPLVNFVCDAILDLPERIGLFNQMNNTEDGDYVIHDGTNDVADLGKIISYKGKDTVDHTWWSTADARKIKGSEGTLFHPYLKKGERVDVFISNLCRSVYLVFEKEIMYRGEIPVWRFVLPPEAFDSNLPENEGFCNENDKVFFPSQNESSKHCWPRGIVDISKCQRSQPPIIVSLPNFLYAPDEVKQHVKGLNESHVDHDAIVVDIEPRIGAVVSARRRNQVNIAMWKGKDISFPVNLKPMRSSLVPVAIMHEEAEIDDGTYNQIKSELFATESLAHTIASILMILGAVMLLAAAALGIYKMGCLQKKLHRERAVSSLPAYKPRDNGF